MASLAQPSERRPREHFTEKLVKICKNLDLHVQTRSPRFKVLALWAVGSWSRGALTCGDLDLVVASEGCSGPNVTLKRDLATVMGGQPRGVEIFEGNPQENNSGIKYHNAVEIWKPGASWEAAIQSVSINPDATRMPRIWDALPFDYRDFASHQGNEDLLKLLELQKSEIIQWSVHQMPVGDDRPVDDAEATTSSEILEILINGWSAARKKALKAMVRHMAGIWPHSMDGCVSVLAAGRAATLGRILYRVGSPYIGCTMVGDRFSHLELVLALPWKENRRNIIWRIRRGHNHPHYKRYANTKAWVHWNISQQRPSVEQYTRAGDKWGSALSLAMFTSQQPADDAMYDLVEDGMVDGGTIVSRQIEGRESVDIVFAIDHIDLDSGSYVCALNHRALLITEADTKTDSLGVLNHLESGRKTS